MSPDAGIEIEARFCFPRVSGDEPWEVLEADFQMTFSPRERG